MTPPPRRVRRPSRAVLRGVGAGLLLLLSAGGALLLSSPGVREPLARVLRVVWRDVGPGGASDVTLAVTTTAGVRPGSPAYFEGSPTPSRPVAHVASVGDGEVTLRFEPGEDPRGPWRLSVHGPSASVREAIELAVPPAARERLLADLRRRGERIWSGTLLPDLRARLPDFLARVDPTKAASGDQLLSPLTDEVVKRLKPWLDNLADEVTDALKRKFDLLDRMGLLWKFLRGDAQGLKREILPVAEETVSAWWERNRAEVLKAAGEGLKAHGPAVEAWLETAVLVAAREELLDPMWRAHSALLEAEAKAWLEAAANEVALAPEGGFRTRFAALLRHQLLRNSSALLLLERAP